MDVHELTHVAKFSGGKDSTCMLLKLAEEGIEPKYVIFNFVQGNMPERSLDVVSEIYDVVREEVGFSTKLTILKSEDFLSVMRRQHKPFPNPKVLWCMYVTKVLPTKRWVRSLHVDRKTTCTDLGVRMYESWKRAKIYGNKRLWRVSELRTLSGRYAIDDTFYYIYIPILHFTEKDVYSMLDKYPRVKHVVFKAYREMGNPSTCYVCPYHTKKFWSSVPEWFRVEALKIIEEMEGMEHITRFRLGYQFLLKQKRYILQYIGR